MAHTYFGWKEWSLCAIGPEAIYIFQSKKGSKHSGTEKVFFCKNPIVQGEWTKLRLHQIKSSFKFLYSLNHHKFI